MPIIVPFETVPSGFTVGFICAGLVDAVEVVGGGLVAVPDVVVVPDPDPDEVVVDPVPELVVVAVVDPDPDPDPDVVLPLPVSYNNLECTFLPSIENT